MEDGLRFRVPGFRSENLTGVNGGSREQVWSDEGRVARIGFGFQVSVLGEESVCFV